MIKDYDIITSKYLNDCPDGYEEITVEEFFKRENASDIEIKEFTNTYNAINIHQLLSEETYDDCFQVMKDAMTDIRLNGLNAIVFLSLKPKGKRNDYHRIKSLDKIKTLIDFATKNNIRWGMDSCSAPKVMYASVADPKFKQLEQMIECCESSLFSSYINTKGRYWHCSFTEDEPGWEGVDMLNCEDFIKDVWNHPETIKFRESLTSQEHAISKSCRECPIFVI